VKFIYDDGSTFTTDSSGAALSATDSSGAAVSVVPAGGGLFQDFMNMATYGVRALIDSRLPNAAAPRLGVQPALTPAAQVASVLSSPVVKVGLLGLGAFLLWKKFA
jgi:hypothetical protein